jgi:hypothetical protein
MSSPKADTLRNERENDNAMTISLQIFTRFLRFHRCTHDEDFALDQSLGA